MTPEEFLSSRRKLKLTQPELAAKLGLSERYIRYMEYGRYDIEPRTELSMRYLLQQHQAGDCAAEKE